MDAPYPRHRIGSPARRRADAAAQRAANRAYNRALAKLEQLEAEQAAPPRNRLSFSEIIGWTILVAGIAALAYAALWTTAPQTVSVAPAPVAQPAQPGPQVAAPPASAAPVAEQAPAQPAPVVQEAPQPASALPTAVIVAQAMPEVVTVPADAPLRFAPGSVVPTAAPAPTVATTAPMIAGKDFEYNKEQTCVETKRDSDGARVRFCQISEMSMGAMSSVADFLRTGRIAGEVVR